jgi:hypothetical protein
MVWRRGWDSNPRTAFWAVTRFRVEPVTTSSVPLRRQKMYQNSQVSQDKNGKKTLSRKSPGTARVTRASLIEICAHARETRALPGLPSLIPL